MQGAKRFASLDSTSGLSDSPIPRKRSIRALEQKGTEGITLDTSRAALSRHHVRTLNSQFASWVQAQLADRPYELWEDGVAEYISHASDIMEKFRDVVKWLKTNASNVASVDAQSKAESESLDELQNEKCDQVLQMNSTNASFGWNPIPLSTNQSSTLLTNAHSLSILPSPNLSTGFFTSSQTTHTTSGSSFGLFSNHNTVSNLSTQSSVSQSSGASFTTQSFGSLPSIRTSAMLSNTPMLFGQNSFGTVASTQADASGEDEMPQPSSPSLKKSEEEGIITVHEVKCKVYVKASDPTDEDTWKDKGTGKLSIKCKEGVSKGTKESKPTIIVRNDAGRVLLNALLYHGMKTNVQKNSLVAIFHTAESEGESINVVVRTFLLRTKSSEDIIELQRIITECAPSS